MKRKMLLLTLALPAILSQDLQAQTTTRLTAASNWRNDGVIFLPVDSSSYNYSGGRGGDLMHTLKYDNSTTWNYIDSATGYENSVNFIQEFDGNNNIVSVTYQYWSGTAWVLSSKTLYTYNSSNQLLTKTMQTWGGTAFVPTSQDVYSYNSANKLYKDVYSLWNSLTSTFDASSQKTYIYDGTNTNIINETDIFLGGTTPTYTTKYDYTYTTANKVLNTTTSTWSGSEWVAVTMVTNSYDGSNNMTNKLYQHWDGTTGTFINDSLHVYTYSGGTMPTLDVLQSWDNTGAGTWDNVMEYVNTYNSNNQLTSRTGTAWNVVGVFEHASGDPMAMYYYATYDASAQAVKSVTNVGGDANIYPVPAQSMMHVDLTWEQAQAANITIYNVQGSIVRQWDAPVAAQYNSAVSISNLAEGTYFIKITGAQQGQVVKQFVITH